jgi:molybdopterin-guanine dinucleotide biosynthesis protein A
MDQIEGFILAGGASSRMGKDKSQLLLEGKTFTDTIAETLLEVASAVTIIGGKTPHPRFSTSPDVFPGLGALGGIHAALAACKREWCVVVACDLPFVSAELLIRLLSLRTEHDAVVPIQQDGRPQPLCALYKTEPCFGLTEGLLRAGKRRPIDLLSTVNTRWVTFAELEDLDQATKFFLNINTPADYDEVTRRDVNGVGPITC